MYTLGIVWCVFFLPCLMNTHNRINKRGLFDYEIIRTWECGIVLFGHEVKSIKKGTYSIGEALVRITKGEIFVSNIHIDPYVHTNRRLLGGYIPTRPRKLLAHRYEIRKMMSELSHGGYTLILLRLFVKTGRIKCEIALARKKKKIENKQILKERDLERQAKRELSQHIR